MPRYVDIHRSLPKGLTAEQFKSVAMKVAEAGKDVGMKVENVYYNLDEGKCVCHTEASSVEAIRRAHEKAGLAIEEVVEVKNLL